MRRTSRETPCCRAGRGRCSTAISRRAMVDGILGKIEAAKRADLAVRFDGVSLDSLRARASKTTRSLAKAIAKPGSRFILEIKKASPSQGAIRGGADPSAIARGYAGVADAL